MAAVSELVLLALSLGALNSWGDYEQAPAPASFKNDLAMEPRLPFSTVEMTSIGEELECPKRDSKYRYPGECNKYVKCKNFQPYVRSCPPGMNFDQKYGHCRLAFEVDCFDDSSAPLDCGLNEVYTPCGSSCERTCKDLHRRMDCKYECVEMCKCRMGYVREREGGRCVKPVACEDANSLFNVFGAE